MKRVYLSLALSLDGYIADQQGGYAWIIGDGHTTLNTEDTFDFEKFLNDVDTVIMGRKAFDDCPVDMFSGHKIIVVTHEAIKDHDNIIYYKGDVAELIRTERKQTGKGIYVFGGASVVNPLLEDDLIDEYVLGIIPIILGSGRPLFIGEHAPIALQLNEIFVDGGQLLVRYVRREEV